MQINRLFEMTYLLLNRPSITAKEFATQFEVSPRTIYRDVELLSSAGIPIYMTKGKGGGISLIPHFVLNKTLLTAAEKSDILSSMQALKAVNLEQSTTALDKLSALFGDVNPDWVEVDFSSWSNGETESAQFSLLKASIIGKKQVEFFYHGAESSLHRIVEPLKLCFKGQNWYLYAHCTLRNDVRFFKLRRITALTQRQEPVQHLPPAQIFKTDSGFCDDFVTLQLWLSKEIAYRVYDEFPHYIRQPDGNFIAEISVPRGEWVYYYIATFGSHCTVLSPEDIRTEVRDALQKTLAQYL